eukprot:CAMPEP_0176425100 /NCGR_PEP_ID=MMETSP0127-20121128/11209_1 /TAXON_ID=938130 /ORGANISM="Platyophrya macrostoma, Strain WH" /LENGTH=212 /DNA_ID=CAMNT_0017806239 /DNA_START=142 /DNA_END=780 /DNA_ORIENTATION=-
MAEYHFDTGLLAVTNASVISGPQLAEELHMEAATKGVQRLLGELLQLPKTIKKGKFEGATEMTQLPQPVTKLPREKAPPKPKPLTAWEKFALKKGIALKRKKQNKVFDEERQIWKDKYGKRAREDADKYDWLREVKPGYVADEDGGDPFLDDRRKKQARLEKQAKNEAHNKRRSEHILRAQEEVSHLTAVTRHLSTASNGKFDKAAQKAKKK